MGKSLVITIGLPRSGKTTWAKEQGYPVVNPDAVRLALHGKRFLKDAEEMVWAIAKYMVKALFLAGHEVVIVDATNNTPKRRIVWYDLCKANGWKPYYKIINTPKEICMARAEGDEEIKPVIERMAIEAEWPLGDEFEAKYANLSHVPRAVSLGEGAEEWIQISELQLSRSPRLKELLK